MHLVGAVVVSGDIIVVGKKVEDEDNSDDVYMALRAFSRVVYGEESEGITRGSSSTGEVSRASGGFSNSRGTHFYLLPILRDCLIISMPVFDASSSTW